MNNTLNCPNIGNIQSNQEPTRSFSRHLKYKSVPSDPRSKSRTPNKDQKMTSSLKARASLPPTSPLLVPFLKHKTTIYTPTNTALPCTIEPTSSRSFISLQTLKKHFPPLHLQLKNFHTPLPSIISSPSSKHNNIASEAAKVKVLKTVRIPFAFRDLGGERVEVSAEVLVLSGPGVVGRRVRVERF